MTLPRSPPLSGLKQNLLSRKEETYLRHSSVNRKVRPIHKATLVAREP